MTRRRWALLGAAAVLVVALVGGRWSATETAERAWAATIPNGAAYLHGLALARTVQWLVALAATLWGVGHCYLVYRAIGSVQMPRRLGDIEIVEAVPHRLLVTITLIGGIVYGAALAWAIGDVWRQAVLAAAPPHFGVTDSILHNDLGYYVGELPWDRTRQGILLIASLTATLLITALYASIGSIRVEAGRLAASPHARAHVGLTLAALALAFVWGARLDAAETVTGLLGPVTHDAIAMRGPGADVVFVIALITAALSAVWGWWDRPGVVGTAWLGLLITMLAAYVILPPATRTTAPRTQADSALGEERQILEGIAFGATPESWWSGPASSPASVAATIPLWDPVRVRARALRDSAVGPGTTVGGVRLEPSGSWLLGLAPDATGLLRAAARPSWESVHEGEWARAPGPLVARETDSGLAFVRLPAASAPQATWFGAGFLDFAVVDSGAIAGIPIDGPWRRLALAWALQAPELARGEARGRALVWRRDAVGRFTALAPFARFGSPLPALAGDSLWWISWGSVESETFPLVDTVMLEGRTLRYRRAGLVAALNAVSGTTHLWLAPNTDSLTAAWARIFAPLIQPADSIPRSISAVLQYPATAFAIDARLLRHGVPDTAMHWVPVAADPFELAARSPQDSGRIVWVAQAFVDSATRSVLGGLLAGTVTSAGPRLYLWTPGSAHLPIPLSGGDPDRRAGALRVWPTAAGVMTVQARFWQPEGGAPVARLDSVFVSLGADVEGDVTAAAALHALLRGPELADGSPAESLRRVRALVARMDSALAAGRVARFGALYDSLRALLRATTRAVAPPPGPR